MTVKRLWLGLAFALGIATAPPFASQLLTVGVQLGYVSLQLGHTNVAVTARHYARWAGGDTWRQSPQLEQGQVPADLLAQLRPQPRDPGSSDDLSRSVAS